MSLNSLLQSPDTSQRLAAKAHVTKWERTGLLEGLHTETEKASMAMLLENQARQLVKESNATGTAAGSEEWAGVALPLVRRIFAEFAAKEFVSVQPMNLPSGLIFYLDFKYGTAKPGFDDDNLDVAGTATHPFGAPDANDSMFGVTNTSGDPSGGLYGAGRFGYSIPDVSEALAATAATTGSAGAVAAGASSASMNFDSLYTANSLQYFVLEVNLPTDADKLAIRSFTLASGSLNTEIIPVQAFSTVTADYTASFVVTASLGVAIQAAIDAGAVAGGLDIKYSTQPTDITRGDFEDKNPFKGTNGGTTGINEGTDIDIPEVNLELQSEPIVAKTRKLKAVWTPEFAQDLNAYHSIDAEAELTSMLSEYVSMEIDLEILDMLISSAPTTEYWSAVNNEQWNGSTGFDQTTATTGGFYNTQGGWFQTLGTKLQKVSNKIHQKTLRGGANFLVTSPAVATILESIPGFAADTNGDKMEFAAGVQKIGAINNRYTVYKNPYMKENVILMGFRGSQFLETGAVFSPYVPLIMTPLVYDPVNFTPRKGVMTRYAKKVVRPEFYGKVYVKGLETI